MTDNNKIVLPDTPLTGKNNSDDVVGEYRHEVVDGEHGLKGDKTGLSSKVTFVVALAWALFQMSTASWLLLDSLFVKAFHLAFALALVFLNLPTIRGGLFDRWDLRILLAMKRVTWFDWTLAALGMIAALYIWADYAGISERPGQPIGRDIIMGVMLLVLMLAATRRVLGPALPVICCAIIA